jgi:hypothetical protein
MDIDGMGDVISKYIHATKYAKYIPETGRRETFDETVDRVVSMHTDMYPECVDDIKNAFKFVYEKKILPSMRSMQFAGSPILKHNARMYNCSFTLVDRPKVFSEIMYLLLCGCGVGYSVQKQHVSMLPPIGKMNNGLVCHFAVGDSIEGWSDAVDALINGAINGYYVEFMYNAIRPEGSHVSSRGTAPGHLGLKESLENIRGILLSAQGRKLTTLECHDIICHIANSVIVGGIRYSSLISIFSQSDEEMMNCKNPENFEFGGKNKHRAVSNNSVAVTRFGDYLAISGVIELNKKNFGDPGFVFLDDFNCGINPCLTPDTLILDGDRLLPINRGAEAKTWSSWKTGEKETVELVCNNGLRIKCTPDHKVMLEDGTFIHAKDTIGKYLKYGLGNRTDYDSHDAIRISHYTSDQMWYNHHINMNYTVANYEQASELQVLLASFGIESTINNCDVYVRYDMESEHTRPLVKSINNTGVQEVWDYRMNVPPHYNFCNGLIAKNCGEIVINPKDKNGNTGFGFCNLVDINVAACNNGTEFLDACKAAAVIATLQAGYASFPYLGKITESIVRANPLIGVSITGIMDSPWILNEQMLKSGAKLVLDWNEYMANKIQINKSPRCTCIKPSGNGSLELGCVASGIHPHHAHQYFRRVLAKSSDAVTMEFMKTNPHMVEDLGGGNLCITFPVETDGMTLENLEVEKFLEYVMLVYRGWICNGIRHGETIHHNISCTVSVAKDKWDVMNKFVWDNKSVIGGITFFPEGSDDIPHCPRQAVRTAEQLDKFNNLAYHCKDIDYSKIFEQFDNTNVYVACESDKCMVNHVDDHGNKFGRVFVGLPDRSPFECDGHTFRVVSFFDEYFIAEVVK